MSASRRLPPLPGPAGPQADPLPPRRGRDLTPRQQRFVEEYLIDLNGKQAAIRAGYRAQSAEVQASKMLSTGKVQAAVIAARAKLSAHAQVTVQGVVGELATYGFSDIGEVLRACQWPDLLGKAPERVRRTIASVRIKRQLEGKGADAKPVEIIEFRLWPKDAALEKLGKYLGMFSETGLTPRQLETFMDGLTALLERHVSPDQIPHVLEGLQQLRLAALPRGETP